MITYSSKFRVSEELTSEIFISNVIEWNQNGNFRIEGLTAEGKTFSSGTDTNNLTVESLDSCGITAARMHTETPSGIWNTDIILNEMSGTLTVRVDKSLSETTENVNTDGFFPNIVSQLISKGLVGKSCGFPVSNMPVTDIDKNTLENAIAISDEDALPIVYLSSRSRISAEILAKKMAGLAVVINDTNDLIKDKYPEPIYIFYPHSNTAPKTLGDYPLHREIKWALLEFLNRKNYTPLETWHGIQIEKTNIRNIELLNSIKLHLANNEALKEKVGDTEVYEEMIDELEKQIIEIKNAKNKLAEELYRTQNENLRLEERIDRMKSGGAPLIMRGSEVDCYEDEQYEIIMDCLKEYADKSTEENTRRHDILTSVIERNKVKGTPDKYREIIKKGFKGYTTFNCKKIKDVLKETNLQIINHSGHYKFSLNGDTRYLVEAAATCSDSGRGGKNLSSEINDIMF